MPTCTGATKLDAHPETTMEADVLTALWQRLDTPGHDACVVRRVAGGWRLNGTAVFLDGARPCQLGYRVDCDDRWNSLSASVSGWAGHDRIELAIEALAHGTWALNGTEEPLARGCVDVDLGFTPATNLILIRRLGLQAGTAVQAPAAWLPFPELRLQRLEQTYRASVLGTTITGRPTCHTKLCSASTSRA
jgi:uncharacterized protein